MSVDLVHLACPQKSQKVVATTKALARSATARKRGAGVVVKPGLNDLELQVRRHRLCQCRDTDAPCSEMSLAAMGPYLADGCVYFVPCSASAQQDADTQVRIHVSGT